jgi:hypothetical protein
MGDDYASPISSKALDFSGTQVTWAGEFPWTHDLCFGTEDGSISVRNENGREIVFTQITDSKEPISGIAFSGAAVAVSTCGEVLVRRFLVPINHAYQFPTNHAYEHLYKIGTHGVISLGRRGFVAPLGPLGSMTIEPKPDGLFQRRVFSGRDVELYFYKLAHLGSTPTGEDIIACAARTDGIMALIIGRDGIPTGLAVRKCHGKQPNGSVDAIDVCRLPSEIHPFAAVSLGIDNSLHFSLDLRREHIPTPVTFAEMQGTAYSVLSAHGHIFMLTSDAFYFVPGLAARFLSGGSLNGLLTVHRGPVHALGCMLAFMRDKGRGGCAASRPIRRETFWPPGRRSPIVFSFGRPLDSTRRASPQIDEAAHAQSVGDLLQAVAGRREDAPEEPALTQLCEP